VLRPRFLGLAFRLVLLALLVAPGCVSPEDRGPEGVPPGEWEVEGAAEAAEAIIAAARRDHRSWERLAEMCDTFGARPAGSEALEKALAWTAEQMRADGLDEVRLDPVQVAVWERGEESAVLLEPHGPRPLAMMGLGRSIGTREEGVTAPVVVVPDFDALDEMGEAVRGKIVLYRNLMTERENMFESYGAAVRYRGRGAHRAAEHGAVATFIYSLTTRSMRTPHTGGMWPDAAPIPAAALSIEDAAMIERLIDRGHEVVVRLTMGARTLPPSMSANAIGELRGRERPEEVVVIGGHIDSWDAGTGAHDDGAGVVMAMEAVRPRRTVRVVLFTNEERGLDGGRAYLERYRDDLERHAAAMESDAGGFRPVGFSFDGDRGDLERLRPFMELFAPLGDLELRGRGSGADIGPIVREGVPGFGFRPDSTHYFDYHHTEADTVDKVDPDDFRDSVAAFTLMTWLLAEMDEPLGRRPPDEEKKDG
jgi:carboxypeptidase Q